MIDCCNMPDLKQLYGSNAEALGPRRSPAEYQGIQQVDNHQGVTGEHARHGKPISGAGVRFRRRPQGKPYIVISGNWAMAALVEMGRWLMTFRTGTPAVSPGLPCLINTLRGPAEAAGSTLLLQRGHIRRLPREPAMR